jgi:membrane protein DedA with SNARE-associated domain
MESLLDILENFWILLQQGQLPEVGRWNYLFLAILVTIEGPIATLLGAAAASAGLMRLWGVFLAAAVGNISADALWYFLGYTGKHIPSSRLARWVGLRQDTVDRLTDALHSHGLKILLLAKLTAALMIPTLIASGLTRLPWKRVFPVLFLGEMIWTGTLITIGYFATEAIKNVERAVGYGIAGAAFLFLIFVIWQGRRILMQTTSAPKPGQNVKEE